MSGRENLPSERDTQRFRERERGGGGRGWRETSGLLYSPITSSEGEEEQDKEKETYKEIQSCHAKPLHPNKIYPFIPFASFGPPTSKILLSGPKRFHGASQLAPAPGIILIDSIQSANVFGGSINYHIVISDSQSTEDLLVTFW